MDLIIGLAQAAAIFFATMFAIFVPVMLWEWTSEILRFHRTTGKWQFL